MCVPETSPPPTCAVQVGAVDADCDFWPVCHCGVVYGGVEGLEEIRENSFYECFNLATHRLPVGEVGS